LLKLARRRPPAQLLNGNNLFAATVAEIFAAAARAGLKKRTFQA